jgi:nickel-dependent lactate racemase
MHVSLAYGETGLVVDFPGDRATVIEPAHAAGLRDERAAVLAALRRPVASPSLAELARKAKKACVVFTDITRATPNERLIPWILEELAGLPREAVTLLNSTGSHRPNTPAELEKMLGAEVVRGWRVVNHESEKSADLVQLGTTRGGAPALYNRHLVEADLRVITGFIEPHFFAGFSGGPKGIVPGCAGLATIISNHGWSNIADPKAAFGVTAENPLWDELRELALRVGPSFLVNVALNAERRITGVFAGDLVQAHRRGCEFVRETAMRAVEKPFDVVVTTNSGYPLDMNLYQGVKGMSAGARILKEGGTLILAAECREGMPTGSPCDRLLRSAPTPAAVLEKIRTAPKPWPEQWQAQIQCLIQQRAEVLLHSRMPDADVRAVHLTPCRDLAATVREKLAKHGPSARVAVLPQGPLTIPYVG